ncbi:hypothetical protein BDZ91DRAFT_764166 [Kalaharituber pfeilii]|nr:hypothetical protein BDZ91DRAFT_764166 [Kalaharituber pfeilii]
MPNVLNISCWALTAFSDARTQYARYAQLAQYAQYLLRVLSILDMLNWPNISSHLGHSSRWMLRYTGQLENYNGMMQGKAMAGSRQQRIGQSHHGHQMAAKEDYLRGGRKEGKFGSSIHKDKGGNWEGQTWGEVAEIGGVRAEQKEGIGRLALRSTHMYLVRIFLLYLNIVIAHRAAYD